MVDQSPDLDKLVQRAIHLCEQRYGAPPDCVAVAPGRVNLIGEHVDYNDGLVLPMAIEKYTIVAGIASDPSANAVADFYAEQFDESFRMRLDQPIVPAEPTWTNYVRGVVAGCLLTNKLHTNIQHKKLMPSMNAVIVSSVPLGGGLSSSAALEVAIATYLESALGFELAADEKALLCQRAEHEFAKVPCGIMDQFSSVFGQEDHLMLLDCRSQRVDQVPFTSGELSVLIVNSNVKHALVAGEYAARREQCERVARQFDAGSLRDLQLDDLHRAQHTIASLDFKRAHHVITEIARVRKTANAIRCGDWSSVGRMMYDSHESLQKDFEVSCDELDWLVESAREIGTDGGVIGARMTGGGFGGCTVNLVRTAQLPAIRDSILRDYKTRTGITATAFASRPARGAHVVHE